MLKTNVYNLYEDQVLDWENNDINNIFVGVGKWVNPFEKEDFVGGRMASREKDGLIFDIGADHLCNLYTQMREYCEEFDLSWEKMKFLKYGLFKDGEILKLTDTVSTISKMRMAFQYFKKRRIFDFFNLTEAVKYDVDNAYHYMESRIGKEASDLLVDGGLINKGLDI